MKGWLSFFSCVLFLILIASQALSQTQAGKLVLIGAANGGGEAASPNYQLRQSAIGVTVEGRLITSPNYQIGGYYVKSLPWPLDLERSKVEVAPSKVMADGVASATVTVSLMDLSGDAIPNREVIIDMSPENLIEPPKATTNALGQAAFRVKSTKGGEKVVTAIVDSAPLIQKPLIVFEAPVKLTELKSVGDKIDLSNLTSVGITGQASPNAEIKVSLNDGEKSIDKGVKADLSGLFKAIFDATNLKDGIVSITAYPDGNLAEKKVISLIKNTEVVVAPGFELSSVSLTQDVKLGQPAVFVIQILAKGGFNLPITLEVTDLPKGASGEFDPKTVTPALDSVLLKSQLTITDLQKMPEGEAEFLVTAKASDGKFKELKLKLKKKKEDSAITLVPTPTKLKLHEKLKVQGQLLIPPESPSAKEKIAIEVALTSPAGEKVVKRVELVKLEYEVDFEPDKVGLWQAVSSWSGDETFKVAKQSKEIEVGKGEAQIQLQPVSGFAKIGSVIKIVGSLQSLIKKEPLKSETVQVDIIRPAGIKKVQKASTNELGSFEFEVQFDSEGTWQIEASWGGNENYLSSKSETLPIPVAKENAKAIIVLGGGSESQNTAWNQFASLANYVYKVLKRRDLTDDDIYYLSPTEKTLASVDSKTSKEAFKFAITDWAAKRTSKNVPLFIYLLSHNLDDKFLLEKSADREVVLTPEDLATWLDVLDKEVEVTLIIEACFSGNFIVKKRPTGEPVLSKSNRVIITSAKEDKQALILRNASSFSKAFFDQIVRNQNINAAFKSGGDLVKALRSLQSPRIDANGDGRPNDPTRDFPTVEKKYIPEFRQYLASVPEIKEVTADPRELKPGEKSATIEVKVIGTNITSVFGNVFPPDFDPNRTFGSWEELKFDELKLVKVSEGVYKGEYQNFTQPGEYSIVVYAENPDGEAIPTETKVKVLAPTPPTPKEVLASWDVNSDGEVNIFDMVIVANNFDQQIPSPPPAQNPDVNSDGKVDIFDLVAVATHFGEKTGTKAAPARDSELLSNTNMSLSLIRQIRQLLAAIPNPNSAVLKAIFELERLIAMLELELELELEAPSVTKALPNYPNPFNPETWIPYQLAENSQVAISIYDISGRLVRKIDLGQRHAGFYIEKEKAAHWDGTNLYGEPVASGVYFYTFQAGHFIASGRLLMIK